MFDTGHHYCTPNLDSTGFKVRKGWNPQSEGGVIASFLKGNIWMDVKRKPAPPEGKAKTTERKFN